ncbi:MAG: hypothetical protein JWO46_1942 [Nocardioidaceae bacterium]|nr:hypothetical protein [Nocardioidaceae bacterium]
MDDRPVDNSELQERGSQLLLGAVALTIGGILVLFALMYYTQDTALQTSGGIARALLMSTAGVVLGGWSAWLYRGSIPMVASCVAMVLAGGFCLVRVLPYL